METFQRLNITLDELQKFREMGIIDETALRDLTIREEYYTEAKKNLRPRRFIKDDLSIKHHISRKAISRILYSRKPRRKEYVAPVDILENRAVRYISVRSFARLRGVGFKTVYRWINSGKLQKGIDYIQLPDNRVLIVSPKLEGMTQVCQ